MAGFSFQCRPSGRKQWAVRGDVGRTSLHGLRSQMAEDGCPDSQVVMAKKLLDGHTGDEEESSRQGVYWLIKASEQGNEEATQILQQCLERGKGITELNFLDVKACLKMSQEEKLARRAARKMFARLSAGEDFITSEQLLREISRVREAFERLEGRYCLSPHYLAVRNLSSSDSSENMRKAFQDKDKCNAHEKLNGMNGAVDDQLELLSDDDDLVNQQPEDWSSRSDVRGEKLSEEHLVSAAVMYAQGELPLVQRMLDLQHTTDPAPVVFFNPLSALVRAYSAVIEVLGRQDPPLSLPSLSTAIQITLALIFYSLLESVDWSTVLPIALYHGSFMSMIVFTCQMLHRRHEFQHFRVWSGLFLRYSGGSLNPDEAEYQYCRNNLKPYAHFFVALIINLMMYPLLVPHWTPHSELTVLSLCLTFLSLYYFLNSVARPFEIQPASGFRLPRKQLDLLVLFSFAVNVLAKYPYDLDSVVTQGWRFVDVRIPTFASYIVGHGIEFCLNFRGVFYLLMPAVFLKLAARDHWRGTYRVLIPHCVTLAWWQVAVLTAQGSTWYGLIRATLAVVGMVLFLPLAGLATILLPLAAATRFILSEPPWEALEIVATTVLASTPLLMACWLSGRSSPPGSLRGRLAKLAVWTQVIGAVGAAVIFTSPFISNLFSDNDLVHSVSSSNSRREDLGQRGNIPLTWNQYETMCHKQAWEQSSIANIQKLCSQLQGVPVKWEGFVVSVQVSKIQNPWKDFVRRLPEPLGSLTACVVSNRFHEHSEEDSCSAATYPSVDDQQRCKFVRQHSRHSGKCSLSNWDSFEFEVEIKMNNALWGSPSMNVFLHADDYFRNMTFALRAGDHIWFTGLLSNSGSSSKTSVLGGLKTFIHLDEAGCIECKLDPPSVRASPRKLTPYSLIGYVFIGTKFLLNCLLNPIVIFK